MSPSQTKTPDATCIVLDGAAIILMMKPAATNTFDVYAQQVFIPYMSSQLRIVSRVDLVWKTRKLSSPVARAQHTAIAECPHPGPCSHEEADRRMLLHVSHATQHGHHQMLICIVDTDAVVLAVFAINHLTAVASIQNWQELSLPGNPPNSCEPWTTDVICPTNVPCF
ncbi:hypothetical protein NP493_738g01040 [Ridgeia piscesae]|uniref:Uncharacterized protein n=1 Tax=Ridgeia piscesae TaxID=27915 RepID=A0AAD9KPY5_RIDPI|nr:hypothetical protein NP493_738g01040 [Ridgeia piscesae]